MKRYLDASAFYNYEKRERKNLSKTSWLSQFQKFIAKLNYTVCEWIIKEFANNSDPKISQKIGREGNIYWEVYNPIDRRYFSFGSKEEVRIYLEQRYNH